MMTITFTVTNGTLDRIHDGVGGIVFALSNDDGFPNYRALIKMEDIPDYLRKKVLREERKWSGDPLRVPLCIRRLWGRIPPSPPEEEGAMTREDR